jgi:stage II sporulation protein D
MNNKWMSRLLTTALLVGLPGITGINQLEATPRDSVKKLSAIHRDEKLPSIKVLIAHNVDSAIIEVKGKYHIFDPYTGKRLADRSVGKRSLIQPLEDGLKWGEEFPGTFQLQIIPNNPRVTTLVDGFEYRGALYVYDVCGQICIINEVSIEDYLCSVLTSQINGTHSDEALAAMAIAARTDAYHRVQITQGKMDKAPLWHVDAEPAGYLGYGVTCRYNGIEQAIETTKHMVLTTNARTETGAPLTFPTQIITATAKAKQGVASLSLEQAETLAKKGENAAQILTKAFPNTSIQLIYMPEQSKVAKMTK